jgi:hypothetical protein
MTQHAIAALAVASSGGRPRGAIGIIVLVVIIAVVLFALLRRRRSRSRRD